MDQWGQHEFQTLPLAKAALCGDTSAMEQPEVRYARNAGVNVAY
ncbi:MAG TPA: hypothetical protein VFG93_00525 [Gaiellaceae bacterium]|nr:hypothetical protein [Gaiellaceae bacterium]